MDIAKTLRDRRENPMKNGCNLLRRLGVYRHGAFNRPGKIHAPQLRRCRPQLRYASTPVKAPLCFRELFLQCARGYSGLSVRLALSLQPDYSLIEFAGFLAFLRRKPLIVEMGLDNQSHRIHPVCGHNVMGATHTPGPCSLRGFVCPVRIICIRSQ